MTCPSADDLRAFVNGNGLQPPKTFAEILEHLETCTECDSAIDAMLEEQLPLLTEPPEGVEPLSEEECAVNLDAIKVVMGTECLTRRLLNAYCRNELCMVSQRWVENHLRTCHSCNQEVSGWYRRVQDRILTAIFAPGGDEEWDGECTAEGES